jgi:mRNA interferase MazF
MHKTILKGDVYWVNLDPVVGTETKKRRPAVIISNNTQNSLGKRFIIAPITPNYTKVYPFEVLVNIQGNNGKAMLDQIRAIDQQRLDGFICSLAPKTIMAIDNAIKIVLALP